jgi:hypothetical protein
MQVAQQITGRFRPGQSGNPAGRLSRAEQRARIAALVEGWIAELGGKVGSYERDLLTRAAELSLLHPRRNEDAIRTANTIARLLGQAGFRGRRREEESAVARMHREPAT